MYYEKSYATYVIRSLYFLQQGVASTVIRFSQTYYRYVGVAEDLLNILSAYLCFVVLKGKRIRPKHRGMESEATLKSH